MRDKMKTENYDMRVLKWNRVWNDGRKRKIEREREREREQWMIYT